MFKFIQKLTLFVHIFLSIDNISQYLALIRSWGNFLFLQLDIELSLFLGETKMMFLTLRLQ